MSFVAEDGTGLEDANSFVSVADADSYFALHNQQATWSAATEGEKQTALVSGTRYIQATYKGLWIGNLKSVDQALDWPRTDAYDRDGRELDGVPTDVASATCELAISSLTEDLAPNQDGDTRVKRETVGPITTEFDTAMPRGRRFPMAERFLAGLLTTQRNTVRLVRT